MNFPTGDLEALAHDGKGNIVIAFAVMSTTAIKHKATPQFC